MLRKQTQLCEEEGYSFVPCSLTLHGSIDVFERAEEGILKGVSPGSQLSVCK